ncbi:MAG: hypothetical protein M3119_03210 [Verrucomicrobiota bacterium]|nr:hypothetical protein [Verrucomicrobiota bacterium]
MRFNCDLPNESVFLRIRKIFPATSARERGLPLHESIIDGKGITSVRELNNLSEQIYKQKDDEQTQGH